MDDELFLVFLIGLIALAGWILGVIGFFRAGRARAEVRHLREELAAATRAGGAAGDLSTAASAPAAAAPGRSPLAAALYPPPETIEAVAPEAPAGMPPPDTVETPPPAVAPLPPPPKRDLETLLTTRWGIWAGALALLMAAVFLIRYAVEQELLGPGVRCTLAALLGIALIGGAEWLRRHPGPVKPAPAEPPAIEDAAASGAAPDPAAASPAAIAGPDLAPAALAAAGVGALFGAAYAAGVLYGLIPPIAGFVLMAAASLIGLALALLHGQLVAAIGLIGAFVTPALVQTDHPSMPGLFIYLLFVTAAALGVVRYTAWIWLGFATTIAGAVWVLIALSIGPGVDAWAPAFFVPAAAALNLALLPGAALDHPVGRRLAWVPVAVLGVAGLALCNDLQSWETRAGVLLLAPLTVAKAAREARLRLLPFLAALLALLLFAGWSIDITDWPGPLEHPRDWTPEVVQALMATAALISGFFAAAGLWFQDRREHPLPWASMTASVPVLAMAVCYWRVALFQTRVDWGIAAFALSAGLTGTASLAMRGTGFFRGGTPGETRTEHVHRQIAGVHAAGAVAALSLGCAMLLADQWLSLAVSLVLPALAWIEDRADLPPLRRVALAVAAVVLVRLLANWYVLDYAFGRMPVLNGLLPAYGVPAASFWLAARLFRRRGDDLTVAVLEAGALAFATVLVSLEIRQAAGDGSLTGGTPSFGEAALHVSSLAIMAVGTMRIATRLQRPVLGWGWRIQGGLALIGGAALLVPGNPAFTGESVGTWPVIDWLLPAYLLPAALAGYALMRPETAEPPGLRRMLGLYALVAGFTWVTLEVRHLFHPAAIGISLFDGITDAELWAWSAAWIVYGALLLLLGLRKHHRNLRLGGLVIIALTTAKVFIVDMSGLEGLWRVLSFLGLGLALIGLGTAYRRLAGRGDEPQAPPAPP